MGRGDKDVKKEFKKSSAGRIDFHKKIPYDFFHKTQEVDKNLIKIEDT
jgi:hypothetical protein